MPAVLFAGVPVAHLGAAREWWERLLDRPPDMVPNENEVAWQVAEAGWVYVVTDAARAGRALVTVIVEDLDRLLAGLEARGLGPGPVETYDNGVRRVEIVDPEGNQIAFGEVPGG